MYYIKDIFITISVFLLVESSSSSLQFFTCNDDKQLISPSIVSTLYSLSNLQCGTLCNSLSCFAFEHEKGTQTCKIAGSAYSSTVASISTTVCLTATTTIVITSTATTAFTTASTATAIMATVTTAIATTTTTFTSTTTTAISTTTRAATTAVTTVLPGDSGALCILNQSFSLYVQATGATFYCCHGWEYENAVDRDLTFYPAIAATDCRYNCDVNKNCFSFTYYGNSSCQLSSCSNDPICTKSNVTTADVIWCYY